MTGPRRCGNGHFNVSAPTKQAVPLAERLHMPKGRIPQKPEDHGVGGAKRLI